MKIHDQQIKTTIQLKYNGMRFYRSIAEQVYMLKC